MNITSAKYVTDMEGINTSITAIIDDRLFCVPVHEDNLIYNRIMKWAEKDGVIESAD